jgi:hypothetical protein
MIKFAIKWYYFLAIITLFLILAVFLSNKNQRKDYLNQVKINQLRILVDSLSQKTTKSVVEYKDRIKTNTKIVNKWNEIHDTIINRDTLLVEAKKDIQYLDTSLRKCDTALSNCLRLSNAQSDFINALKCPKIPLFATYMGVGFSLDNKSNINPAIHLGIGINLNKIIQSKK